MGGGGSPSTQTTVQKSDPWGPLQPYLKEGFQRSQDISQTPLQFFPGQTYAGFGPQSEQALSSMFQRGLTGSPLNQAAQQGLQRTIEGDFQNPFLQDAIGASIRPIQEQLEERTLPGITSQYALAGRAGPEANALREAQMGAVEDASRLMSDQAARLSMGAYESERGRQMGAMGMAPMLAGQDYADISQMMGAGQMRDLMSQRGIDEAMARHQFGQTEEQQRLMQHMNLLGMGTPFGTTTSTGPSNTVGANPFLQGIGAAGTLMGGLGAMGATLPFSDRRLKRDIEYIGSHEGIRWYTYRYLWSPVKQVGVMAQELLKVKPDAVFSIGSYLAVDYGKI